MNINMPRKSLTDELLKELDVVHRTIDILEEVKDKQPIGIRKLGEELDIEEHKIRYSLQLLQKCNLIEPTTRGARIAEDNERFEEKLAKDFKEVRNEVDTIIAVLSE